MSLCSNILLASSQIACVCTSVGGPDRRLRSPGQILQAAPLQAGWPCTALCSGLWAALGAGPLPRDKYTRGNLLLTPPGTRLVPEGGQWVSHPHGLTSEGHAPLATWVTLTLSPRLRMGKDCWSPWRHHPEAVGGCCACGGVSQHPAGLSPWSSAVATCLTV